MRQNPYEVIVVGGGPAGLSAALILGRCRRRVLVIDAGQPRNAHARAMHGFLSRDGIAPAEFLRQARESLQNYPEITCTEGKVVKALRGEGQFEVTTERGESFTSRMLLLATGILDALPPLPHLEQFYGASIHHCPYCDGWEHRDQRIAVYGSDEAATDMAWELLNWTRRITLVTGGTGTVSDSCRKKIELHGIQIDERPIRDLKGSGSELTGIEMADGEILECDALFFAGELRQSSELPGQLGCDFAAEACLERHESMATNVPGVYVAGNACRGLHLAIMAAAGGAQAAHTINEALQEADLVKAARNREAQRNTSS